MPKKNKYYKLDHRPENFGLLLKGGSLDQLHKYNDKFDQCMIVSDWDDELKVLGNYLLGKEITHFASRSMSSCLTKENYIKYNIKNIQLGQVFRWDHFVLMRSYLHYASMFLDLNVYFLPEKLRKYNDRFGDEYKLKFPNTGVLSIIYTLDILKPKNLWLFGLDFYTTDYYVEQIKSPDPRPSSEKYAKIARLGLVDHICELFSEHSETKIFLGTYYKNLPKMDNVEFI